VVANATSEVVVDLGDVGYLDSAGLRVLAGLASRLRQHQITLRVAAPDGTPARRVIELTGLAPVVGLEPAR